MEIYTVKVYENGYYWYQNGNLHRTDGPAVEWASGTREWYQNGQLHRTDGPAIENANGNRSWFQQWWQNDKRHRLDGAAVEYANGHKEWWINGVQLTQEEFNKQTQNPTCENRTVIIDGIAYKLVKE